MCPGELTPASIFYNTSLKRDKESWRKSTVVTASQTTVLRTENCNSKSSFHSRVTILPNHEYERKNEPKSFSNKTHFSSDNIAMENTNIYRNLLNAVHEEKNMPKDYNRITRHQTASYISSGGIDQQENENYQMTESGNFPPTCIKKLYEEERLKLSDGNVNYNNGNLEKSGFLYFSIENRLILLNSLYYVEEEGMKIEPIIIELPKHALTVKEIQINDLDMNDISCHPFGQRNLVLMIWFPWEVAFYAFEPESLCKVVDLKMRFDTSCEVAHLFDYSKNGEIFYMGNTGEIGKIDLFYENSLSLWGLKKYSIREYIYRGNNDVRRKYTREENQGIYEKVQEYYKNVKYYFSKKETKGISLIIDRNRNYLFTLTETREKNVDEGMNGSCHREIKVYNIRKDCYESRFEKIQKSFYNNPPKEERKINEQQLYDEIGKCFFKEMCLKKFQIFSIYVIETAEENDVWNKNGEANLLVILTNGTRILLHFSPEKMEFKSIVHLPNLELSFKIYKRNCLSKIYMKPIIVEQNEPENFKLIVEKYCEKEKSLVMMGEYNKRTVLLLFTAGLANENKEEVEIMWEKDNEGKSWERNMFFSASNCQILVGAELDCNMYKSRIANYKYNQIEKRCYGNETFFKKQIVEYHNVNKIKEFPESRQVLHYPRQFLFVQDSKVIGIMKLRLVDVVVGVLQKEISNDKILMDDYQISNLYCKIVSAVKLKLEKSREKVELLAIFFQIFCDVDGVYFFNQFSIHKEQRKSFGQTEQRGKYQVQNKKRAQEAIFNSPSYTFGSIGGNNKNFGSLNEQKICRNLKFKRCKYEELTGQGDENFETERLGNAIKTKGDCVLGLIVKLMIFLIKNKGQNVENFRRQQNEWPFQSFRENSQLKCEEIEESALKYISRLISPIWSLKLKEISPIVFPYIADICKNMIDLINRMEIELAFNRIYCSFQEISKLFSVMMEYNNMLSLLSFHPDLSYGEGLGCEAKIFEEALFLSCEKYQEEKISECRNLIPNFFTNELYKSIKMQDEIKSIENFIDKKKILMNNKKILPIYIVNYYIREGTITKKESEGFYAVFEKEKGNSSFQNVSAVLLNGCMNIEQKVEYALKEMMKETINLKEKEYLLTYAKMNINNLRSLTIREREKKMKVLKENEKILRLQRMMFEELIRLEEDKKWEFSVRAKELVNCYVLTTPRLKTLVEELRNPMIELVYFWSFNDDKNTIKVTDKIQEILNNKPNKILKANEAKEKFTQLFQLFDRNDLKKLPLLSLIEPFDKLVISEITINNFTALLKQNNLNFLANSFWVPFFLADWGWSEFDILDYYINKAKDNFNRGMEFNKQKKFMYYWISALCFVRLKYIDGRNNFNILNEKLLLQSNVKDKNIGDYELFKNFESKKISS